MAGLLGNFGNWLIQDPNAPPGAAASSGGLLGPGTPTASTQTPTQPTNTTGVPYALQPYPQSRVGIALQGILAGLGTTGYKGSAAVGAGAGAALQQQMAQRQQNVDLTMAGQQYLRGQQGLQSGRVGLAENYANLAITAARLNDMTGRNDITPDMLLNHPEMASAIMGAPMPQTGQPVQQSTATGSGAIPLPGYNSAQVGSPLPPQGAPGGGGAQQPQGSIDPTLAGLKVALQKAYYYSPDKVPTIEAQIAEYQGAAQHAADIKTAEFNSPAGFAGNMEKLKTAYNNEQSVKTMQEVQPIYSQAMASEAAHTAAKSKDEELASDIDLTNSMLKLWNPNNANLRPGTTEAVQEAEGWYNRIAKLRQQILGGTGLSPEVRSTMIRSMQQHYAAYQNAYNATVGNYRKQAGMYGAKPEDEGLWRSDYTQGTQGVVAAPEGRSTPQVGAAVTPPSGAVAALRENPALTAQFDAKYGPGASDKYLHGD